MLRAAATQRREVGRLVWSAFLHGDDMHLCAASPLAAVFDVDYVIVMLFLCTHLLSSLLNSAWYRSCPLEVLQMSNMRHQSSSCHPWFETTTLRVAFINLGNFPVLSIAGCNQHAYGRPAAFY